MSFNSSLNLDSLVVPVKSAALYTAQETSLFMSGALIPMISVPAGSGSAQVPLLGAVTAQVISAEGVTDDATANAIGNTNNNIPLSLHVSRAVLRDLGGINPAEVGRVLGNAVAKSFDTTVIAALAGLNAAAGGATTLDDVLDSIATIRATGEMGQLNAVLSPEAGMGLIKLIGTAAYAGGDFQTEALRNGYIGKFGGVNFFMSAYVTGATAGYVFGADAARIAVQGSMNIEVQRRAEAVGNDIVASMAAGVAVVDATRGLKWA